MNNANIPHGYDENGVRAGVGKWEEQEEQEERVCLRCGVDLNEEDSVNVGSYSEGFEMCEVCASDMGVI